MNAAVILPSPNPQPKSTACPHTPVGHNSPCLLLFLPLLPPAITRPAGTAGRGGRRHPALTRPTSSACPHTAVGHNPNLTCPLPLLPLPASLPSPGLLAPLGAGAAVILPSAGKFTAHSFWKDCVEHGATYYTAVPTIHQARACLPYVCGYVRRRLMRASA